MHRRISKKIFIYLFIFLTLVTINNTNFSRSAFTSIDTIEIYGLNEIENELILNDIKIIRNRNIFYLKKKKISEIIYSNKIVEKLFIIKIYPSKLKINIEKTNFIAFTKKDNLNYYIGSNGNLIKANNLQMNLPFIFGDVDIEEFLEFKKVVDNSNFNFSNIKNLYYFKSKRWDLETEDGLIIKLPYQQIKSSLDILSKISKKKDFKDIKVIDFRHKNQIIVND